jgi:hypothetical protein
MRTLFLNAVAALIALASWGCAEGGFGQLPTGPGGTPGVLAAIGPSAALEEEPPFLGPPLRPHNGGRRYHRPAFDLVIITSSRVNLHEVTIRMIDGTHLGGPTVTVPQPELVRRFGTTEILAGTKRTLTFRPEFEWTDDPRAVAADVSYTDDRGLMQQVTAEGSWR